MLTMGWRAMMATLFDGITRLAPRVGSAAMRRRAGFAAAISGATEEHPSGRTHARRSPDREAKRQAAALREGLPGTGRCDAVDGAGP